MKLFNFTCPQCGTFFYADVVLIDLKIPIHCPGCDKYYYHNEYEKIFQNIKDNTLSRLDKPITQENMFEIIYIPKK